MRAFSIGSGAPQLDLPGTHLGFAQYIGNLQLAADVATASKGGAFTNRETFGKKVSNLLREFICGVFQSSDTTQNTTADE